MVMELSLKCILSALGEKFEFLSSSSVSGSLSRRVAVSLILSFSFFRPLLAFFVNSNHMFYSFFPSSTFLSDLVHYFFQRRVIASIGAGIFG